MNIAYLQRTLIGALLLLLSHQVGAQCPNNNTLITNNATPASCPGSITVTCIRGGQYVLVNVVAGNTYTFSTCGANWDTQITLYNNAGGGSLGYNDDACGLQSTVTWVATFTGQLRVLVDRYNCQNHNVCSPLSIQCTPPPVGDCVYVLTLNDSWGDGWGSSYVGLSINGGPYQNYTVTGTTNQIVFGVNIGDLVTLNYNNSGPWQGENTFSISFQGGGTLFSAGPNPPAGVVYSQTVDCEPPPAPQEDCIGSTTICGNQSFNNNANGTGNVADLTPSTAGCLSNTEQQGTWYTFSPSSGGTVAFSIDPTNPADDYDFAIWGPYPDGSNTGTMCPPSTPPLRCSYAAPSGSTGLNYTANDLSEGAFGDKWVRYLDVLEGQVYLLYISNWSQSGLAFSLNWNLGGGASLDCTILPVELISFTAAANNMQVDLQWNTASEIRSDHFVIERSRTGAEFHRIGIVDAAGTSNVLTRYHFTDHVPYQGINYYRLLQVDDDGSIQTGPVAEAYVGSSADLVYPNPTDGTIYIRTEGDTDTRGLIRVKDLSGRMLLEETFVMSEGMNELSIDLGRLAQGSYVIELFRQNGQRMLVAPVIRK